MAAKNNNTLPYCERFMKKKKLKHGLSTDCHLALGECYLICGGSCDFLGVFVSTAKALQNSLNGSTTILAPS